MGDPNAIAMRTRTSHTETNDEKFKIILCGCRDVGKTAIFTRLKYDKFDDTKSTTTAPDQCMLDIALKNNVKVKVNLCDTVGMENFNSLTRSYFTGSHVVLIVFSTDVKDSLDHAEYYKNAAKSHAPGACLVIVQNKIDLGDSEVVSEHDTKKALNSNDFKFSFKTSAKTRDGIKDMKIKLGSYLFKYNKGKKKSGQVAFGASNDSKSCCWR